MVSPVIKPFVRCPRGYINSVLAMGFGSAVYRPWNNSPVATAPTIEQLGAVAVLTATATPADLSTISLTINGIVYQFQFVYNTSVQTLGIKVPLPNSGVSTNAQVNTALLAVVSLAGGTDIVTGEKTFPWVAGQTGSAQTTISLTTNNPITASSFAVNVTGVLTAGTVGVIGSQVPGKVGASARYQRGN
jgi:hypothetical protein